MAASDIPKSVKDQMDLTSDRIDNWLKNDLLRPGWWVLIALVVVCLAVWFVMLDKKRLHETLLFAALLTIICLGINEYGEELILWNYPVSIIPVFPSLISLNLLLLPLACSLAYQYSKTAWRFLWAALIITAVLCFAVEPLLSLGNMISFSYPVVPQGKARIRTQVSAGHSRQDLDFAVQCFKEVKKEMGI